MGVPKIGRCAVLSILKWLTECLYMRESDEKVQGLYLDNSDPHKGMHYPIARCLTFVLARGYLIKPLGKMNRFERVHATTSAKRGDHGVTQHIERIIRSVTFVCSTVKLKWRNKKYLVLKTSFSILCV